VILTGEAGSREQKAETKKGERKKIRMYNIDHSPLTIHQMSDEQ
jgi:hypothetical protein